MTSRVNDWVKVSSRQRAYSASDRYAPHNDDEDDSDPEEEAEQAYAQENGVAVVVGEGDTVGMHGDVKHKTMKAIEVKALKKLRPGQEPMQVNGVIKVARCEKNQRRPRSGRGRGDAKKQGSGGKFTWGDRAKVVEESPIDPNDPNYDSDAQTNVTFEMDEPELDEGGLTKYAQPAILEFFENSELRETLDCVRDLHLSSESRAGFVRLLITLSLDRKSSAKELASELLSHMVNKRVLAKNDVARGFHHLLNVDLKDLILDYPTASQTIGDFIARCVADLALDSQYMDSIEKDPQNQYIQEVLDRATLMLKQKHRLHDIWGVGGGMKPVRFLVRQIQIILKEYLNSGSIEEANRCLSELEVPHFHHEFVYQAGVIAIESMHDQIIRKLSDLLMKSVSNGQITIDDLTAGFQRLFACLPDLCLDVPPAYTINERWVKACQSFIPTSITRAVPHKGRKRFVSEGDGGRLKVVDDPTVSNLV